MFYNQPKRTALQF